MIIQTAVSTAIDLGNSNAMIVTIVALDDNGQMWLTKNGGKKWEKITAPGEN